MIFKKVDRGIYVYALVQQLYSYIGVSWFREIKIIRVKQSVVVKSERYLQNGTLHTSSLQT